MTGLSNRQLLSHASVYALATVLRNAASIIMLPIYTRYLTPSDYGVIELLTMMMDIAGIVLAAWLGQAVFRFYGVAENEEQQRSAVGTAIILTSVVNALGIAFIVSTSDILSKLTFGTTDYSTEVALFSLMVFFSGIGETTIAFVRARQKPWHFLAFSVTRLAMQIALNLYLVVFREMHVDGVIWSAIITGVIMSALQIGYVVFSIGISYKASLLREMIGFSWPVMLSTLLIFYLTFGDRYFLRTFAGLNEVGVYALAYKFGFLLVAAAWGPFLSVWESHAYTVQRQPNAVQQFQNYFIVATLLLLTAAVGIGLFVREALQIMSAPEFHAAASIAPIVLIAYVMQCWTDYCRQGILVKGNTIEFLYGAALASVAITVGYAVLIPLWHGIGAAWAKVIGFGTRLWWIHKRSSQAFDMQLPWRTVWQISAWAFLTVAVGQFVPRELWLALGLKAGLFVIFVAGLLTLPMLPPQFRTNLQQLLRHPARVRELLVAGRPVAPPPAS
jgi:O-antigen/teichoic acid export membrane protein